MANNSKRRRLAKVRVGGEKGSPSPLGNRRARRHGAPVAPVEAVVVEATGSTGD